MDQQYGLLIHYEYCSGCRSCEVACRNEHQLPADQWGVKVLEEGPWQIDDQRWEWSNIAIPTQLCDLCKDRIAIGKDPTCVHHCLAHCIEYGPIEELSESAKKKGSRVMIVLP